MSVTDSFKQKFRTIILMARDSLRLILIASLVTSPSSIANSLTDPFAVDQTAKSTQPSLGITANDLARRFKHPEPGAFELTKFLRNPDTGELECSVTGIDRTTAIATKARNSDNQLISVTLVWNIPIQDATALNKNGVTEQQKNSIRQFYMTALLLIEAIDQSSSVDDRKQSLTDLHLIGSNIAQTDSQLSKNGFAYHTHWTDHKLALTIEAERGMQPVRNTARQVNSIGSAGFGGYRLGMTYQEFKRIPLPMPQQPSQFSVSVIQESPKSQEDLAANSFRCNIIPDSLYPFNYRRSGDPEFLFFKVPAETDYRLINISGYVPLKNVESCASGLASTYGTPKISQPLDQNGHVCYEWDSSDCVIKLSSPVVARAATLEFQDKSKYLTYRGLLSGHSKKEGQEFVERFKRELEENAKRPDQQKLEREIRELDK